MVASILALAVLAACSAPEDVAGVGSVESVTINDGDASVVVDVGGTAALAIRVVANGDVSTDVVWASEDEDVATVDEEGRIEGVSRGRTTVTAASVVDDDVRDTIEVVVSDPDGEPTPTVNGVTIDGGADSRTLDVGATITLPVEVDTSGGADASLVWTSSNEAAATVSDGGVVNAVGEGTAVVTATSVVDGSVSDDIAIVVVSDGSGEDGDGGSTPAVTSVTIEGGADTVTVAEGGDVPLDVSVAATGGADSSVTWSSEDASVATVSAGGVVTGASGAAGASTTVTATSVFDPSVSDTITVTVEATGDGGGDPVGPGALNASVTSATGFDVDWTATDGVAYELRAVAGPDAASDAGTLLAADATPGASFPLPSSATPLIRLLADGEVVAESYIEDFVYSDADYDVYVSSDVDHSEPPIEGTLRRVLELADPGSLIAFAPDIDVVQLHGVALEHGDDAHLMIEKDVTIAGAGDGVTLQGVSTFEAGDPGLERSYESRVLYVGAGSVVTLENLTITGGTFIYHGAGIMNLGDLTIRDSTITGNRAWHTGGGVVTADGSSLTIENSVISDNSAHVDADEIGEDFPIRGGAGSTGTITDGGWGGGLYVRGTASVTVTGTTFSGNRAKVGGGGAYVVPGGSLVMVGSDVTGNLAAEVGDAGAFTNFGGGILAEGVLTFDGGTFGGNVSQDVAGGLLVQSSADVTLGTAAFVENVAAYGGGIYHYLNAAGDNLTPADPLSDPDLTFTANDATANDASDDYFGEAPSSAARMSLSSHDGELVRPTEGTTKRY